MDWATLISVVNGCGEHSWLEAWGSLQRWRPRLPRAAARQRLRKVGVQVPAHSGLVKDSTNRQLVKDSPVFWQRISQISAVVWGSSYSIPLLSPLQKSDLHYGRKTLSAYFSLSPVNLLNEASASCRTYVPDICVYCICRYVFTHVFMCLLCYNVCFHNVNEITCKRHIAEKVTVKRGNCTHVYLIFPSVWLFWSHLGLAFPELKEEPGKRKDYRSAFC